MSFTITKPLRIGNTYNNEGVLKFVLSESNTTDFDNFDLMVADYYLHFPRTDEDVPVEDPDEERPEVPEEPPVIEDEEVWI